MSPERSFSKTARIILILIGTMLLFRAPNDPDFGWHYKYGEWMTQHLAFPKDNVFSFTMLDYKWADSYWLSEVLMFITAKSLGFIGLSLVFGLLFSILTLALVQKIECTKAVKAFIIITFWALAGLYSTSVRPFYFSSILVLLLSYILLFKEKYIKFLPILFLVWANMHADFVTGLFIFGVHTLFTTAPNLTKNFNLKVLFRNTFPLFLSFGTTLINPYGISLWLTMLKEMLNHSQFDWITEWMPLHSIISEKGAGLSVFVSLIFLLLIFAIPLVLNRKKIKPWYLISNLFFFLLLLRMRYFVRIFVVFSLFATFSYWNVTFTKLWQKITRNLDKKYLTVLVTSIFVLFLVVISLFFIRNLYLAGSIERWSKHYNYPYKAVVYLKTHPVEGNILNHFNWGGYLIWQLPEYKPFIDGRMTSWVDKDGYLLKLYDQISEHSESNAALLESYIKNYNIKLILIPKDSHLAVYLKNVKNKTWEVVYEDELAVVLGMKVQSTK